MPTSFHEYEDGDLITSADLNATRGAINALELRDAWIATNDSGATIQAGQAVRLHSDGTLRLAQANSLSNGAIAIALVQIADEESGEVAGSGVLTLVDWTDVIGGTELTPAARYYLTPSALGMLQPSAPTANPDILQFCGVALSITTLLIDIESPIGL